MLGSEGLYRSAASSPWSRLGIESSFNEKDEELCTEEVLSTKKLTVSFKAEVLYVSVKSESSLFYLPVLDGGPSLSEGVEMK